MSHDDPYDEVDLPTAEVESGVPPLPNRQRQVHEALAERGPELGRMYLGALQVMKDVQNPDRFAQAAHSLREALEKAPGAPIERSSLKEKVRELEQHWPTERLATVFGKEPDSLVLNATLRGFLHKCRDFFAWFKRCVPSRAEEIRRLLGTLDPGGRRLAPPIEKIQVERWIGVRDQLIAVTHHNRNPSDSEFNDLVERFQDVVIDYLCPRTFADQDKIDRIIAEGEGRHD